MVKAADINKDIKSIAEKVGTAVFSYDEIHNSGIKNTFHYDYQKVIDEVSRLNGRDMTEELVDRGILTLLPEGEYRVNVGTSTKNGGGLNYYGMAFFSFSSKDYRTKYHELAHSLQQHYGLFNEETVDKMYAQAADKLGGAKKAEGKFVDRSDYMLYLNEMHSESFAYAALMLRAKNPLDLANQTIKTYVAGVVRNFDSLFDFRKPKYGGDNANTKYYTSYSVMKETIKQVWKVRLAKKRKEFFNADGVLDDEKLAKFTEQAVIKSAYTPRTLNTLFKNKFFSKTSLHENGWRRDMVKSVLNAPLVMMYLIDSSSRRKMKEHSVLRFEEKKKIEQFINTPYQGNDKEVAALRLYSQLMIQMQEQFDTTALLPMKGMVKTLARNNGCSEALLKHMSEKFETFYKNGYIDSKKGRGKVLPFLRTVNKIVKKNIENPFFAVVCASGMTLETALKSEAQKQRTPDRYVLDLKSLCKNAEGSGFGYYPVVSELKKVAAFAEKYDKSGKLKKNLEMAMLKHQNLLEDKAFRDYLTQSFAPATKQKAFAAELDTCMNSAAYDYMAENNNPRYLKALQYLSESGCDDLLVLAQEKLEEERDVQRNKNSNQDYQQTAADGKDNSEGAAEQTARDVQAVVNEPEKTPKEKVAEKLKSWGIEDGSYVIITPEDNAYTTYGTNEVRSVQSYFDEGAKDIQETGKEVVYGTNNGLVGAYFAEGAYVVSNNFNLRNKLYYKGQDNGFGVMLSNGEQFANADGSKNELLNYKWKNAKNKGIEVTSLIQKQFMEQQKRREQAQQAAQLNSQAVSRTSQNR